MWYCPIVPKAYLRPSGRRPTYQRWSNARTRDGGTSVLGIATLSGPVHAAALVGIVLAEALLLYVGYGGVFRLAGEDVKAAIEDR